MRVTLSTLGQRLRVRNSSRSRLMSLVSSVSSITGNQFRQFRFVSFVSSITGNQFRFVSFVSFRQFRQLRFVSFRRIQKAKKHHERCVAVKLTKNRMKIHLFPEIWKIVAKQNQPITGYQVTSRSRTGLLDHDLVYTEHIRTSLNAGNTKPSQCIHTHNYAYMIRIANA